MEVKPGYKQTEVGVIPEEWKAVKLGECAKFRTGPFGSALHKSDYTDDGVPVVNPMHIVDGRIEPSRTMTITELAAKNLSDFRLKVGEIVIGRRGDMGRCAVVQANQAGWLCGTGSMIVRCEKGADVDFVQRVLSSPPAIAAIEDASVGTTMINLNQGTLAGLRIQFPPLPEQRAIAEALSDADELLGGLDRLIAKKRDLKQAAMQQLLTGQTRLPGFGPSKSLKQFAFGSIPEDWDVKPLKSVSSINGRIGWQGLKQEEFTMNSEDPFLITGMNFKDGKIRWEEVYHIPERRYLEAAPIQLRPNDVLMTKDGTIGKLLYVDGIPHPGRASLNSHLLVFRPIADQYNSKFLFYQLNSPTFAQHIELHKSGTTFFGLSQTATGKYPTVLPSLAEQTAIAEVLSEMDGDLAMLEQRREKTRALKQAMMQELLTGRTRLA